jgi:DNA-binding transcriptional MerR regulator
LVAHHRDDWFRELHCFLHFPFSVLSRTRYWFGKSFKNMVIDIMRTNGRLNGNSPIYNIKAVVQETGLKSPTIRAWERRYGLPNPVRTDGGHRQYSRRDIDTLKWLIDRQGEGLSISHAIDLWRTLVERGQDPIRLGKPSEADKVGPMPEVAEGVQIDQLRQAWVMACLEYDGEAAEQAVTQAFARFSSDTVAIRLLQQGLREIGQGWFRGTVTVQQEHFASALAIRRLEALMSATPPTHRPERIVLSAAPGDRHSFSPLLLAYLLRRRGLDVVYLGVNLPATDLERIVNKVRPELTILSAQLFTTAATLHKVALDIQRHGIPFAYGGQVFNYYPDLQQLMPGFFLGRFMEAAVQQVEFILDHKPLPPKGQVTPLSFKQALGEYQAKRAYIESYIWDRFVKDKASTERLGELNQIIAPHIAAALRLGKLNLLGKNIYWFEDLLTGQHFSRDMLIRYLIAYYQGAMIYLGASSPLVSEWLAPLEKCPS